MSGREEKPQPVVASGVVDADREVDARDAGREPHGDGEGDVRHLVATAVAAGVERARQGEDARHVEPLEAGRMAPAAPGHVDQPAPGSSSTGSKS